MERAEGAAKFDLFLQVMETPNGLVGSIEYATDLFDPSTIERLLSTYSTLLEGIVAQPGRRVSEYALLSAAERELVVVDWNPRLRTTRRTNASTSCLRAGGGDAGRGGGDARGRTIELWRAHRRSNQIAHHFARAGSRP